MRRGYAALAILALIWGASFMFIKVADRLIHILVKVALDRSKRIGTGFFG